MQLNQYWPMTDFPKCLQKCNNEQMLMNIVCKVCKVCIELGVDAESMCLLVDVVTLYQKKLLCICKAIFCQYKWNQRAIMYFTQAQNRFLEDLGTIVF